MVQPHIQKLLEDRYFLRDEDGTLLETIPEEMFGRVAHAIADAEISAKALWEIKFYDLMAKNKFLPNTPTLINAGKEKGVYAACNVLEIPDSMEGIFDTLKKAAIISKYGGGLGLYFGDLREEGSVVKSTGQTSSGPISFMQVFDAMCNTVKQGGSRRGAMLAALPVWHPDIEKFVACKDDGSFSNFNISVVITDEFMEAVEEDMMWPLSSPIEPHNEIKVISARELWNKIVEHAHKTGDPGLIFIDEANRKHPLEQEIKCFNACVTSDTLILTNLGYKMIGSRVGKETTVWNGYEWSTVIPSITGENQNMLRVTFSDGSELTCTIYHKFILKDGSRVEAEDLHVGQQLVKFNRPVIDTGEVIDEQIAYANGVFSGDGSFHRKVAKVFLYGEKKELAKYLPYTGIHECSYGDRIYVDLPQNILWDKTFVPNCNWSVQSRLDWLAGLIDTDGTKNDKGGSISISSINRGFLILVKLMLDTVGTYSTVSLMKEATKKAMPDGNGGQKDYECQDCWRLVIPAFGVANLIELGLNLHRVKVNPVPNRKSSKFVTVTSIEEAGIADKVYCFTESKNHSGVFNGIMTAQCGEQPLLHGESCVLGSINLMEYVEAEDYNGTLVYSFDWDALAEDIPTMVRFLDDIIDASPYPLEEVEKATKAGRKIGLGIMGWADCLIKMQIPYDSQEACDLAEKLMEFIFTTAQNASANLAKEKGVFSLGKSWTDRRNATLLTVAPTGSLSRISGCSSGIEPIFAWKTHHKLVDLEYDETHPVYEELAASGFGLTGYMKTANEIAPEWHLKMQAAFQKHVDSSISKTINLHHDADIETVEKIYMWAWKNKLKGITIYRDGSKDNQPLNKVSIFKDPEARPMIDGVTFVSPNIEHPSLDDTTKKQLKKRGPITVGVTHKVDTGRGKIYITINYSEYHAEPVEVFIRLGHLSTPTEAALAEWSGRLISLLLKYDVPLESIVRQGNKVYADTTFWYNKQSFCSLPKLISHLLGFTFEEAMEMAELDFESMMENGDEYYEKNEYVATEEASNAQGEFCYNCGTYNMIGEGGCRVCQNCGFEKCGG